MLRITKLLAAPLCPANIELGITLPGKSHPPVELHRPVAGEFQGVSGLRLGHSAGNLRVPVQWAVTNQVIMGDLSKLPPERWCAIEYDSFLTSPMAELKRLCDFSQVVFGPRMKEVASKPFRISKHTLTMPHPDKWKKNAADLRAVIPSTDDLMSTLRSLV